MGSLKPIMVENALIAAGSDPVVAKRLSGGAGLKGDQAVDFCKKNGGLKITQKQGMKLYRQGYPEYVARAEKWVGKPAVWNALDQKMRDVLVDLFYVGHNGTNNTNLAGKIADSVASNNVGKFKTALSALSEKFPGYESRFQSRISYLDGKYPFRTDLGWTD
jgi:hypothetical protein